jgi:ABC-2 type transport system ATP-binding protein
MNDGTVTPLLTAEALAMRFGSQRVFADLSFSFGAGAVALVGPNGSGKSTLIALLCGVDTPSAGTVTIAGHDLRRQPARAKAQLAYVPDEPAAYDFMCGSEFLAMVDALRGRHDLRNAAPLIEGLGLGPHLDTRFEVMSLGTRKKFMLVSGLMSPAPLVVLDEPTNGIDADAKRWLAAYIGAESARRLFFFSTHDGEFIEATAARRLRLGPAQD